MFEKLKKKTVKTRILGFLQSNVNLGISFSSDI